LSTLPLTASRPSLLRNIRKIRKIRSIRSPPGNFFCKFSHLCGWSCGLRKQVISQAPLQQAICSTFTAKVIWLVNQRLL
jgi:hypothetical protein